MKKSTLFVIGLASMALLAAGCAGTKAAKKSDSPFASPGAAPATGPGAASPIDAASATDMEPDVRDLATRSLPELKVVNFAYDSDLIDETARGILKGNADYLKAHAELKSRWRETATSGGPSRITWRSVNAARRPCVRIINRWA